MKRYRQVKYAVASFAVISLMLAGCNSQGPAEGAQSGTVEEWLQPPSVSTVTWGDRTVTVAGMASPLARVVFAGEHGEGHAVSADANGAFSLAIDVPDEGLLLSPRIQTKAGAVDGQGMLFLSAGKHPAAAILFIGEGAYRLAGSGRLDAVDADGKALILSGHSVNGQEINLSVGGQSISVDPNEDGRWAVVAPDDGVPVDIVLNGVLYRFPGVQKAAGARFVDDSGWIVTRSFGGNAVQSTWLPADK